MGVDDWKNDPPYRPCMGCSREVMAAEAGFDWPCEGHDPGSTADEMARDKGGKTLTREDDKIANMHACVTQALARLEPLFKHHKLTFVARNTQSGMDADVVISSESDTDLPKAAEAILELANRDSRG